MYKLCFFVPETHLALVKGAVFEAGAGRMGGYDRYCWECYGVTQFRPLPGSHPFIGQAGADESVAEVKVETVVDAHCLQAVVTALRAAHPYEMPALEAWPLSAI